MLGKNVLFYSMFEKKKYFDLFLFRNYSYCMTKTTHLFYFSKEFYTKVKFIHVILK